MKTISMLFILSCTIISACKNASKAEKTDVEKVKEILKSKAKVEMEKEVSSAKMNLDQFVPEGFSILDTTKGNLNLDEFPDYALVLKNNKEDEENGAEFVRPLLLIAGNADRSLTLAARNDRVVFCKICGGVFGDPFDGIIIKNGFISVEHYGGSNWRWTRIITFRYSKEDKTWLLSRDGGDSFHTANPEKIETDIKTVKDFGRVTFDAYKNFED